MAVLYSLSTLLFSVFYLGTLDTSYWPVLCTGQRNINTILVLYPYTTHIFYLWKMYMRRRRHLVGEDNGFISLCTFLVVETCGQEIQELQRAQGVVC